MKHFPDAGRAPIAVGVVALALIATLNAGGYRFGVSDQAFYLPAILDELQPALYPHDQAVLDSQDGLEVFDEISAATAEVTGVGVPWLFAVGYAAGLLLLFGAVVLLGRSFYQSGWAVSALGLALTLRHRITGTGVNTFEGYLHPRVLAFGLGTAALVAVLRGRPVATLPLLIGAAVLHPTTGAWFALWLGVALFVDAPRLRPYLAALAAGGIAVAAWALAEGPLAGRLVAMDGPWLAALAQKDYLFPADWPPAAWLVNLAYPLLVLIGFRVRRRDGLDVPGERGLVVGALALVLLFLGSLPLVGAKIALAVQLQIPRVFWMLDLLATVYVVWAIADRPRARPAWHRLAIVTLIAVAAVGRGVWVTFVEGQDRPGGSAVARLDLPATDWSRVMTWLRTTPLDAHVLVDPGHAWRYGTSVRAAAHRDVFLEEVKDAALAIYSRSVAIRVTDRIRAVGNFQTMTESHAQELAVRYDLDYLVSDRQLALPPVFRAGRFVVYQLGR